MSAGNPVTAGTAVAQDIRDIRPPYLIAQTWLWVLVGAAALAVLGVLVWLVLRWWRRPARVSLLGATLARLEGTRPLMQRGDVQGFSVAVSDIIRDYVERRFSVHARAQTTVEFLRAALDSKASPLKPHEQQLGDFLRYCDLAKFARWTFAAAEMEAMLDSARRFVEQTGRDQPGRDQGAAVPAGGGSAGAGRASASAGSAGAAGGG
ncbi:MAG TPA: DUF4381 family protein [Steroidobacteraceae bacterium]|nr:DUF4381 family protein [Steroidobacteraceae bacterium]